MSNKAKYYWPVDANTKEVLAKRQAQFRGGIFHIPKNALLVEPLHAKDGLAVIASFDEVGNTIGSEYIEDYRGSTIYDESNCTKSEVVSKLGPIKEGFTQDKPLTEYDERFNSKWVTNLQAQYDAELIRVDSIRKQQYNQHVDPKISEAQIKHLQGNATEAAELEQLALSERERIQQENPWPVPPTA
ncbi:hypothetical protein L3Q72_06715 [Vibrio sp. JC009]|uniref:hypothetical protein n=1 Tax=Vibrio sp. JC009 TaxID=2912314 RepID=UPI0023AFAC12|nr:hypothetical protein [Vibrio sp. JC009]WED23080.1 hypothetical protein L3Q72_06715 [Vibrio sp. JC009]